MFAIDVLSNNIDLARAGAQHIMEIAGRALLDRGRFSVTLSGGSTPKGAYALLAGVPLDWERIHIFWSDERCVPPDHPDSNYRMASAAFLERVGIPPGNIHRVQGELSPEQAAAAYEQDLRAFCGSQGFPVFDLVLLGLGEDGHTAALFPGSPAVQERQRWVVAVEHRQPPPPLVDRVTLTLPVINAARQVTFLVSGSDKAQRLEQVFSSRESERDMLPAQLVQPMRGNLLWLVDQAARGL
jgi:6-phosphogluconolactonase